MKNIPQPQTKRHCTKYLTSTTKSVSIMKEKERLRECQKLQDAKEI